jgi:hypothetical protein
MKPGQVAPCGRILTRDRKLLASGSIYVTLPEALKAHRYGWRIVAAHCDKDKRAYFTISRKAATTTNS